MNISTVDPVAELFQVIAPAPRLQILLAIGEGEACVCHLEATFGWRQAYLSQHLAALRRSGVLTARRHGRNIHYRISDSRLLKVIDQAADLQGVDLPQLAPSPKCGCPNCRKRACA